MKKIISLILFLIVATISTSSCYYIDDFIEKIGQEMCDHYYPKSSPYQCINCGIYNELKCAPVYKRLEDAGKFLDSVNFSEEVEYCLGELPHSYKNVAQYKSLFEWWEDKRDTILIEEMQMWFDGIPDYKVFQEAYFALMEKENTLSWNFKNYVNNQMDSDIIDNTIVPMVLGEWEDEYGNNFRFITNGNNEIRFGTSLPFSNRVNVTGYITKGRNIYFRVNGVEVAAYRIVEISRKSVTVFCFENNQYYTLEKVSNGYEAISYFVLNNDTKVWHQPTCTHISNRDDLAEALTQEERVLASDYYKGLYPGYTSCTYCKPK